MCLNVLELKELLRKVAFKNFELRASKKLGKMGRAGRARAYARYTPIRFLFGNSQVQSFERLGGPVFQCKHSQLQWSCSACVWSGLPSHMPLQANSSIVHTEIKVKLETNIYTCGFARKSTYLVRWSTKSSIGQAIRFRQNGLRRLLARPPAVSSLRCMDSFF